ncbi:transcriptional regulator, LacI family [Jannaschia faecimaris]|uniref:Transcriptional regulator, LacI family n=1 Tax=Jannaschia faecimaris TaxID=1244108 RepID=A0A1H3R4W4_9RHOB|nr:LacI family DNA-binding transcriptional regulator [Jannaschia faecimaris]SDZ20258.1 transcriptional regulator, LacI family [Jannaschia faecimaris]
MKWWTKLSNPRLTDVAKPTVNDIARVAGVSLATVDRVLNDRPGVRSVTINKVHEAIDKLGYVRDTAAANLARQKTYRFVFVLPDWKGQFLASLERGIAEIIVSAPQNRTEVRTIRVPNHDHTQLAATLAELDPAQVDGLAIMAKETPLVRDAIADLRKRGIPVVSLVSDQPNSDRDHFVGIDNVAAGRTAGTLLGRFAGGQKGKVVVVITNKQSRDMIERRHGFDQVVGANYPHLEPLPSVEGQEDPAHTERVTLRALQQNPDAIGIYSVGASVQGIARAIAAARLPKRPILIDHELTENSAALLRAGVVDAVITQNTGHLARSALRVLRAKCDKTPVIKSQENIRIDIVIRENLPSMK